MKTLLIDNYDSYTYNLYQLIAEVSQEEPVVIHNDSVSWSELEKLPFDHIVISPGPGRPDHIDDFGICGEVLRKLNVPILGVCLGHQGIGHFYGAKVVQSPEIIHGRISPIYHKESQLFQGLPQGFSAVRYHSLMVETPLPEELEEIAWTKNGILMGIRHKSKPIWGVQFHPESICTEYGREMIRNFFKLSNEYCHPLGRCHTKSSDDVKERTIKKSWKKEPDQYFVHVRKLNRLYDPEKVFINLLEKEPYSFWLDSNLTENELARFSFMGSDQGPLGYVAKYCSDSGEIEIVNGQERKRVKESIFDFLNGKLAQMKCSTDVPFDFNTGFVGYFGYELKAECGGERAYDSPFPDAMFIFADRVIVFDHMEKVTYLVSLSQEKDSQFSDSWFDEVERKLENLSDLARVSNVDPVLGDQQHEQAPDFTLHQNYKEYLDAINRVKQYLIQGDSYEINLTNEISVNVPVNPLTLYRNLRVRNPAPYSAFLRLGEFSIVSSSPERFIKIDRRGVVEAKPIKGTIKRGISAEHDKMLKEKLRKDEKNRAENLMIVDLLRNDLGLVCEVGSVYVPKLMDVETYQTVHQLVSTVRGKIREGVPSVDCIRATFPGGSMTGAPKIRSMKIIDELEKRPRGIYSGAMGFLGLNGSADFNIVIRTMVIKGDRITIGTGGAIVMQSDAEEEYNEILLKAKALIESILVTKTGSFNENSFALAGGRKSSIFNRTEHKDAEHLERRERGKRIR